MTRYLGDYREDTNVNIQWSTYDSAGLPVTRSPLGTIRIYKDNVATDNSTVGITDIANFDGMTGIHHTKINLAADAFYAIGKSYSVVVDSATVATIVVNAAIGYFTIENGTVGHIAPTATANIFTTAMVEDYAADGAAPTVAQALHMILQTVNEFAISGTTLTIKKLDGSATAMTITLDDANNPTSRTRAS